MRGERTGASKENPVLTGLPSAHCLLAAVVTPVAPDCRPDPDLLLARCRDLLRQGCDGITLFGTTGEGTELSVEDREATLVRLIADGIEPERVIVSVGALAIADVVRLARDATDRGVAGVLLMPPCVYRSGITEQG